MDNLWRNGQVLKNGTYRIEDRLGWGRFSTTYLAHQIRTNQPMAIKTLNPNAPILQDLQPKEREAYADKFWNEALMLASFRHPHIVRVIEVFNEPIKGWFNNTKYPCIVMEYIDGIDLGKRKEPKLPIKTALRYIQQIGSALTYVHSQHTLHRDIKPGNIMTCTREGKSVAILIDFGLARAFNHPLTQQITIDGYAPLELYSQKLPIGAWTDVYGLAATLYVLLTGVSPESVLDRQDQGIQLTPPIQYNPKISKSINKAIVKALALMPDDRTQSITDFLSQLGIRPWYMSFPQWEVNVWVNIVIAIATVVAATAALMSLFR